MAVSPVSNPFSPSLSSQDLRDTLFAKLHRPSERIQARDAFIEHWISGKLELWKDLRLAKSLAEEAEGQNPRVTLLLEKISEEEEQNSFRRC